jgi:hypothetical protein
MWIHGSFGIYKFCKLSMHVLKVCVFVQIRFNPTVRFLVVELNHSGLNIIFDIDVVFMTNYFFRERRRPDRQRDTLSDRLFESQE